MLKMVVIPRSPNQIAAFYEGREFPDDAIEATRASCFFTIGIHNKSGDILWLDTATWRLESQGQTIQLRTKQDWLQQWQTLKLAQRFQSTFRWTQLPTQLGFQPDEHEGGNITINRQPAAFNLIAEFATGKDKHGKPITVTFRNLKCAQDETP